MSQKIYTKQNSEYLEKNKNWHIEDSVWKSNHIFKLMNKNNIKPKTIVEIGCGAGEILVQLQQQMNNEILFSGYDIAPDLNNFWNSRKNLNLSFFNDDLTKQNKYFDALLMIDVFEHVDDYRGFITKAGNIAKYKIFHIPLDINVLSVLLNTPIKMKRNFGHIHYFTEETAFSTLTDCELKIIDFTYTGSSIDLNNISFKNKLLKYPRKIFFAINKKLAVRILGGYSLIVLTQ